MAQTKRQELEWDFATLKYCEGVFECYYHKCILEKEVTTYLILFARLTLLVFSSAPTVSV